ncbi:MAG: hypothetical protein DMG67_11615 [Acidobacteria bacterium]|nr:MAG: hypothetical protein DMG67_11615 [Acidobacteriota bacterium]
MKGHKAMTRIFSLAIFVFALAASLVASSPGGRVRRDPLTADEIDQLREQAQEPVNRLRLYIKFARARMVAIEQLRSDPKLAAGRGEKVHDLLEDFTNIVDEIDDNMDNYSEHGADIRKPLKELIEAEADWQLRLRTLKDAIAKDPQTAKEAHDYTFTLDTALDSVNDSADSVRKTLEEQNTSLKTKKK